tara:strand:- start:198 stop:2363 length:2166 start_codon:yes stop_codon:yes gene_type:complete
MALKKLIFQPGINRDRSNFSSEGSWYSCDKVRFRQGYPEKIGGWTPINFSTYAGEVSNIIQYGTTDSNEIISIATNEKNYVLLGTELYDVTPLRITYTTSTSPSTDNCFTTVNASTTVTVGITGHGGSDGDYVTFSGSAAVGGVIAANLNTEFKISEVTNNTFEITVAAAATSAVSGGGSTSIVAAFQYPIGLSTVSYGYGWGAGTWNRSTWSSASTTPVDLPPRITFQDKFNNDAIYNIQDSDIFYWDYTASISNRAVLLTSLTGSRAVPGTVGKVMFAASGHLLALSCTSYGVTYTAGQSISSVTRSGVVATATTGSGHGLSVNDWVVFDGQAPQAYQGEYQVATVPSGTTFTFTLPYDPGANVSPVGTYKIATYSGTYDPLLIRWANVDANTGPDPKEWKPDSTNSAGFIRVKQGSSIVTGFRTRQEVLIFTDTALSTLQFLGTEEVFAVQEISDSINIIGPNVVAEANNVVYWMGNDKFFMYDGRVNTLPCTLRQYVFENMNKANGYLNFAGINSEFNEVIWFYCSAASASIDSYVIFNYQDQIWYYGSLSRTAWANNGIIKFPLASFNGYIYKHEDGKDNVATPGASPTAISSFVKSADIGLEDGDGFVLTKRVIPDVNFTNSDTATAQGASLTPEVQVTVGVRNFPGAANSTSDVVGNTLSRDVVTTATVDQYTNQVYVRARGRQMNFKIASEDIGVQWQLGTTRVDFRPDGKRG